MRHHRHRRWSGCQDLLVADITATQDLLRLHAVALMDDARLDVEYDTKLASPERTGELVNSVHSEPAEDTGFGAQFELFADAPHAVFVVEGTRAHVISPTKEHGLLVFEAGGQTVFVHGPVHHPGTQPNKEFWSDEVLQDRLTRALEASTASVVTHG